MYTVFVFVVYTISPVGLILQRRHVTPMHNQEPLLPLQIHFIHLETLRIADRSQLIVTGKKLELCIKILFLNFLTCRTAGAHYNRQPLEELEK